MYTEEQEEVESGSPLQAVDTTALVRSSVQSAVGMLRDQGDSGLRSAQRVEILLTLLCDHDEIKGDANATAPPSFGSPNLQRVEREPLDAVSCPNLDR